MENKHLVFVYGSLKKGYGNHRLLSSSTMVGAHVTTPEFTMYHLGGFPGIVCSGNTAIHGEVYSVDDETFERLDHLEGYPMFYNRKQIPTKFGNAWVYYLKSESYYKGNHIIDGGVW